MTQLHHAMHQTIVLVCALACTTFNKICYATQLHNAIHQAIGWNYVCSFVLHSRNVMQLDLILSNQCGGFQTCNYKPSMP